MNTPWVSEVTVQWFLAWLPVWGRALGLVVNFPVFGQKGVPVQSRIGLSLLLGVLIAPTLQMPMAINPLQRAALFGQELLVGLGMGYVARLLFAAVQMAGQFVDAPMGLGMAGVADVVTGARVPLFGQFYYYLVGIVFLTVDGHLVVLRALGASFHTVAPGTLLVDGIVSQVVLRAFTEMFKSGLSIAAPVLGAVLVTDAALALANRAVPQLSMFSIGFPLKTVMGLLASIAALPFMMRWAAGALGADGALQAQLQALIQALR